MNYSLRQLEVVEAIARLKSYTKAAKALYLTQPAVSIQVRQLEEQVGQRIFEQIGKRIDLTQAGQAVYEAAQDVLTRLKRMEIALAEVQGEMRGPLSISVVTTAEAFVPYLLQEFCKRYPLVQMQLTVSNREHVLDRMVNNQDDLVLMGLTGDDLAVEAIPFMNNPLVWIASPQHPLVKLSKISLEQLAQETVLIREKGSGTRKVIENAFGQRKLQIHQLRELGSIEAIKNGVMAGMGISLASAHNLTFELATGALSLLEVEGFPLERMWYAVRLKGKQPTLVAKTFVEFLQNEAEGVLTAWQKQVAGLNYLNA